MVDGLIVWGGGHVVEEQDEGEDLKYGLIRVIPDMSNRERVRYEREELLALQQHAAPGSLAVWSDVLVDLGPVAQELSELDAQKAAVSIRKRNVDRRQRGAGRLPIQSPAVIWCGRKGAESELVYEPVAPGSKLDDLAEADGECAGFAQEGDDDHADVYASSDSDEESFQPRAFAVQGEPDFESGPPQDGWEYLRRVRWEAALYPKVKVARIDPKKFASAQTPYLPDIPEVQRCAPEFLPLPEWETQFLAEFSDLRLRLAGLQLPPTVAPTTQPSVRNKAVWQALCFGTIPVSTASEEESHLVDEESRVVEDEVESLEADGMDEPTESMWSAENLHDSNNEVENFQMKEEMGVDETHSMHLSIASSLESEYLEASTLLHDEGAETITAGAEEDDMKIRTNGADLHLKKVSCMSAADLAALPDMETVDNKAYDVSGPLSPNYEEQRHLQLPEVSVLLKLDSVSRAALLRDQVSWLQSVPGLPRDRALWLFSMAAVVDKPLDAETSAALRALFRRCAEIRAAKSNDDDELVMLNMLLAISGRYFGQAELASGNFMIL